MSGIPGLAPLQEVTVHVDPYMREGHPVAGYKRVLDVLRSVRDPLSATSEGVMPNGARVTMPDTSRANMLHVSLPDRGGYQQVTGKTGDELLDKVLKAVGGTKRGNKVQFNQFKPEDRPIGTGTFGAATSGPPGKPLPHAPGQGLPLPPASRRTAGDSVSGDRGVAFGTHPASDLGTGTGGREEPQGIPGLGSAVAEPGDALLLKARARPGLTIAERHQLRIAKETLRMHPGMSGVMGGPSPAEARAIIRQLTKRS